MSRPLLTRHQVRDPWTESMALSEARRRWPARGAFIEYREHEIYAPCRVGVTERTGRGLIRRMLGRGLTWQRAFASADLRARGLTTPRRRRARRDPEGGQMELGLR